MHPAQKNIRLNFRNYHFQKAIRQTCCVSVINAVIFCLHIAQLREDFAHPFQLGNFTIDLLNRHFETGFVYCFLFEKRISTLLTQSVAKWWVLSKRVTFFFKVYIALVPTSKVQGLISKFEMEFPIKLVDIENAYLIYKVLIFAKGGFPNADARFILLICYGIA